MDAKYFKTKKIYERSRYLHDYAKVLLSVMIDWCLMNDIEPVVTSTVSTLEEDLALNRKSSTHRDGRAFDISTRGWSREHIEEFQNVFNNQYGKHGAISKQTGKPKLILHHNAGTGMHFHVQLNTRFAMKLPRDLKNMS